MNTVKRILTQDTNTAIEDGNPFYYLFFMEKKRNIIMDGFFTKIALSNTFFTMNGLYVSVRISQKQTDSPALESDIECENKYFIFFDPYTIDNRHTTETIIEMEEKLLSMYGVNAESKTPIYLFKTQLLNGSLKIHHPMCMKDSACRSTKESEKTQQYILKVSGIWENAYNYGITYKFTPYIYDVNV